MKKKYVKQIMLAAVLGAMLAAPAYAEETEVSETELGSEVEESASAGTLSDKLFDFQIQIDGVVYEFPMNYADFTAQGWELNTKYNTEEDELSPNQYGMIYFTKDDVQCMAYALNLGMNTQSITDCLIGGIELDNYDWPVETSTVLMAGGIQRGVATVDDITAAYGTPSDTYEGDLYTQITYEKESYCEVEFTVYNESGVLEEIDLRNFVEPEGFDAGEASEEVPEEIAAYEAPSALGTDLLSYNVEFDGVLYQLPCPVSVLVENGWEIDEDNSASVISAKSSDWVYFIKGGLTFHVLARNEADYATIPENCWVEELSADVYDMKVSMRVPGGLEIGTTEEDLLQALDDAGISYEKYEGSSYVSYQIGEYSWDGICFYVCTDEDSSIYTPGTVYKIEVGHEKE